jgi:DNA-binding beta-propeller fold protein YncE
MGSFLEKRAMRSLFHCSFIGLLLCVVAPISHGAQDALLELVATIPMPAVKGRIDHLALDEKRNRLYVAALGNDTLEVLDVSANRLEKSIAGFGEPQDVLYVPDMNRLYVTSGSANRVDVLDGTSLAISKRFTGLEDADNLRYDVAARRAYIGYGKGALRIIDLATDKPAGDIRLSGHPESFQLERAGTRIFVNVPTAKHVAVVDRARSTIIAMWDTQGAANNFPMALDEASHRLFVGARNPAVMLVYDTDTGKVVAKHPIGEDADDIFLDAARKRVYVICGEGRVDVFRQDSNGGYVPAGSIRTSARARTGLFVPEEGRLYVAAPAIDGSPARVLVYRIR